MRAWHENVKVIGLDILFEDTTDTWLKVMAQYLYELAVWTPQRWAWSKVSAGYRIRLLQTETIDELLHPCEGSSKKLSSS